MQVIVLICAFTLVMVLYDIIKILISKRLEKRRKLKEAQEAFKQLAQLNKLDNEIFKNFTKASFKYKINRQKYIQTLMNWRRGAK